MPKLGFILLLFVSSCSPGKESKMRPAWLLPEDKMIDILTDIHITEAGAALTPVHPDTLLRYIPGYHNRIFQKNGVKPEEFKVSFEWYLDNPLEMEKVYEGVLSRLAEKAKKSSPDR